MKRILTTAIVLSLFTLVSKSQTLSEVFNDKTKIYFFGLDFTQAHFVGSNGFKDPKSLSSYFFPEWNNLFIKEASKYSLQRHLRLTSANYIVAVSHHLGLNVGIDLPAKITDGSYAFSEADVKKSVLQYKTTEQGGVGLSYIVEALNKTEEKAIFWVTFFNLETKEVLLTEKIIGRPSGGSYRSYWAGAILDAGKLIGSKYYKYWKESVKQ